MKEKFAISALLISFVASAAENWISIGKSEPPLKAVLVNIGSVVMNGNGNRVATVRALIGNHRMDIVTEFDCANRRTRHLASASTDEAGHLVAASGPSNFWFNETQSSGIAAVCAAPLTPQ